MSGIFACYMYTCMYVVVALDKNDNNKNDNNIVHASIRHTQESQQFGLILLDQKDDLIVPNYTCSTQIQAICSSYLSLINTKLFNLFYLQSYNNAKFETNIFASISHSNER